MCRIISSPEWKGKARMNITKVKTGSIVLYGTGYSRCRTLDKVSIKPTYFGGYDLTALLESGIHTVILEDWNKKQKAPGVETNNYTVVNYDSGSKEWKAELLPERPAFIFPNQEESKVIRAQKAQEAREVREAQRAIEVLKKLSPDTLRNLGVSLG
jgi:hypothetical protein